MSQFNTTTKKRNIVKNHEDQESYSMSPALELYALVCTCIMSDKFYQSSKQEQNRLKKLLTEVPHEFIAKLAVYAREEMYLRSIPLVLAVELSKLHKGDSLVSKLVERVIQRADEITEVLAYYQTSNNRKDTKKLNKLSKQLQKGVSKSFHKFNEYQFSKYNRDSAVKLRDALFITHPKPKSTEEEVLFKKIAEDTLEVPYTWEVELSKLGQEKFETPEDKTKAFTAKWEELIDSNKVGYMAMLRNLRNILEAKVSAGHITKVCNFISDETQVKKSKQLPFRFYSAYKMLKSITGSNKILKAVSKALDISSQNVPDMNGRILTAIDLSGSMSSPISEKSTVSMMEVGAVLGSMFLSKPEDNIVSGFGTDFQVISCFQTDSILTNVDKIISTHVGHSTNGYKVIKYALGNNINIDTFILFSDMQTYNDSYYSDTSVKNEFSKYKKAVNPNARIICFDVAGYGTTPVNTKNKDVVLISGWSDKVFTMLSAIEKGSNVLDEINKIEL